MEICFHVSLMYHCRSDHRLANNQKLHIVCGLFCDYCLFYFLYRSAEVADEKIERPFEKLEREREREREKEREKERERERDRDRERDEGRDRDRRKPRREEAAPYSKNKRGNVHICILRHTRSQMNGSRLHEGMLHNYFSFREKR